MPKMHGIELRRIRRGLRLTQAQLADRLGVQRVTVARWEIGRRKISEPVARLVQRVRAEIGAAPPQPEAAD